jgi:FkbM family methyltransferase
MDKKPTPDTLRDLYELRDLCAEDQNISAFLSSIISRLHREVAFDDTLKSGPVRIGTCTFELDFDDPFFRPFFFGYRHEQLYLDFCLTAGPPGGVVWDVGASAGLYAVQIAKAKPPPSLVLAFEPGARALKLLRRNVERNNAGGIVEVFDCALGAADGKAAFQEARNSAMSGLSDTRRSPIERVRPVAVRTADAVWAETGKRPVDIMKIDVEGHESEVLEGAAGLLSGSPDITVLFEISYKNLSPEMASRLASRLAALAEAGWRFYLSSSEEPVRTFDASGGLKEVNATALMVRAGSAAEGNLLRILKSLEDRGGKDHGTGKFVLGALTGIKHFTEVLILEQQRQFEQLSAELDGLRRQHSDMSKKTESLSAKLKATERIAHDKLSEKQGIAELLTERSRQLNELMEACAALRAELERHQG